ncbi:MAG: TIR domain-containing protein [bacterium]|nr:TIR domain-containing protein [bacterium]
MNEPEYQVALSFAGEQRAYVEEVARHLQAKAIGVFYDGFETARLWGKSGAEIFTDVYGHQAGYVVMFISKAYVRKVWPRVERRAAISRMIAEDREYVLPVRFDDTPVPGLPEDMIYLRADDYTPASLAALIAEKLGVRPLARKASDVPPPRMTALTGEVSFDYSSHNGRYVIGSRELAFETKWTKASNQRIYVYNDPPSINGVAVCHGVGTISQVHQAATLDYTSRSRTPALGEVLVLRNVFGIYAAIAVLAIKDNTRGDERDELRFRYAIQANGSDNFAEFIGI